MGFIFFVYIATVFIAQIPYDDFFYGSRSLTKRLIITIFWPISLAVGLYNLIVKFYNRIKTEIKEDEWWD